MPRACRYRIAPMSDTLSPQEALIYVMVTMSAAEGTISDTETVGIGRLVQTLPVFKDFDTDHLVKTAKECGELLASATAEGLEHVLTPDR
jgi:hypothetical protein